MLRKGNTQGSTGRRGNQGDEFTLRSQLTCNNLLLERTAFDVIQFGMRRAAAAQLGR
jgi:hypothetical protein